MTTESDNRPRCNAHDHRHAPNYPCAQEPRMYAVKKGGTDKGVVLGVFCESHSYGEFEAEDFVQRKASATGTYWPGRGSLQLVSMRCSGCGVALPSSHWRGPQCEACEREKTTAEMAEAAREQSAALAKIAASLEASADALARVKAVAERFGFILSEENAHQLLHLLKDHGITRALAAESDHDTARRFAQVKGLLDAVARSRVQSGGPAIGPFEAFTGFASGGVALHAVGIGAEGTPYAADETATNAGSAPYPTALPVDVPRAIEPRDPAVASTAHGQPPTTPTLTKENTMPTTPTAPAQSDASGGTATITGVTATIRTPKVHASPLVDGLRVDANAAAWRLAGSQFVKLTRDPLVGLLSRHLAPGDESLRGRIAAFMETELGSALLASLLSAAIGALPVGNGNVTEPLARELRVRAMAGAGDVVADVLMGPLREVISTYLRDMPAVTAAPEEAPAGLPDAAAEPLRVEARVVDAVPASGARS